MPEMNLGQQIAEAFWVTVSIISLIGLWFYLDTPAVEGEPTRWRRLCAWFNERYLMSRSAAGVSAEDAPLIAVLPSSERTIDNGSEAFSRHGTERTEPFGFALSEAEIMSVQKMGHYIMSTARLGRVPSKSGAILAGFGIKRGASPRYERASLVYDTIFGPPKPAVDYPERTPEQEATHKALHPAP